MNNSIVGIIVTLGCLTVVLGHVQLLDQLNYFASQSQYAAQVYSKLQVPFSLENIMASSLETAMETCRNSFKWERWNCPRSDFFLRRTSKSLSLDREDSYVNAITTAAVLYSITKNCSSGIIAGCGSCSDSPYSSQCSDNPKAAEQMLKQHTNIAFMDEFYDKIWKHNYKAITNLLEKSLIKQCGCAVLGSNGLCAKEVCLQVLKPFEDIAADIRQMYEEGLQLNNTPENSRIMWDNIPLDALVYMKDSPNYCEPDAMPHWNGMRGRQCSTGSNGENLSEEDRTRCRYLCRECGYTVRPKNIVTESRCNCKFTWGFQVQCEMCVTVQRQYYCY
ncbi:wnt inhibitor of Dorsal protein [Lucilia cuprina]|uniref:wnt inhibitor of Dorsal protein n=1 Tax=Lucilia cuprina TaxID=7375 RepID=UPI001F06F9BF|nr:wnt inhibitor of Dorsal protein [Lucilia cuprina]